MMYFIIAVLIAAAIGSYFYFQSKYANLSQELEQAYQLKSKDVYRLERDKIKAEELEKIKAEAAAQYQDYKALEYEKIDLQIAAEKTLKEKDLDAFAADIVREWHILQEIVDKSEKEKELTLQELEELKAQREQLVQALKREEELRQNRLFHSIILSRDDKEDIEFLRGFSEKIHKKTLINKLIWSEYVLRPYTEMANRVVGKEKRCGIYKITEVSSGRAYIGQSTDIRTRWANHLKTALGVDGGAAHARFHDALGEIGIENFTFEILEDCGKDKLNEREKFYINFYQSNDFGWNSTKGNG